MNVLQLINCQTVPDNQIRTSAEKEFASLCASDPSSIFQELISISVDQSQPITVRQSAILHVKRLVPLYWSLGFASFQGPPVDPHTKSQVRFHLVHSLVVDQDSKVRNGAAYATVQIASCDFPDEWADLLEQLYALLHAGEESKVLGGVTVLKDVFDEIISEEMFFHRGVGSAILAECEKMIGEGSIAVRTEVMKLLNVVLRQLNCDNELRQPFLVNIHKVLEGVCESVAQSQDVAFKIEAVRVISLVINEFHSYVEGFLEQYAQSIVELIMANLAIEDVLFRVECIELLSSLPVKVTPPLCDALVKVCTLPDNDWEDNFNEFVTVETEMSVDLSVRLSVADLVGNLPAEENATMINYLIGKYQQVPPHEPLLFLLGACFANDSSAALQVPYTDLLSSFIQLTLCADPLIASRAVLVVPAFLDKYQGSLDASFGVTSLEKILSLGSNSPLVKAAIVVSFTLFNHFVRCSRMTSSIQSQVIRRIVDLMPQAEEDTNTLLMEALTLAVNIDSAALVKSTDTLHVIFHILFQDCRNIQLILDAKECLTDLLSTDADKSNQYEMAFPILVQEIEKAHPFEYTPELSLCLEILGIFLEARQSIPSEAFNYLFPLIAKVIMSSSDNQILQIASETLVAIVNRSADLILQFHHDVVLLELLSKYLSPELSDSAALNVGDLVLSVINNPVFRNSENISHYQNTILESLVKRLVQTKETVTVENMVLVLNHLASMSPSQTVDFLCRLQLGPQPAFDLVMPIWLNTFEVVRGYDKILINVRAFTQIFKLNDPRVSQLQVRGDLIPNQVPEDVIVTRSRAKAMPLRYESIPLPLKMVKLLVNELKFQSESNSSHIDAAAPSDDGWEDLEDVGVPSYDKLASFVDDDHRSDENPQCRELLQHFFKECMVHNYGNFKELYNWLKDGEKRALTEFVFFE